MKTRKITLIAVVFAVIVTLFTLTAYAVGEDGITLAEDYRTLEYNGDTYRCINYAETSVWLRDLEYQPIEVTVTGDDGDVTDVEVYFSGSAINLDIYFGDHCVTLFYIADSSYDAFLDFEEYGSDSLYTTNFFGNVIDLSPSDLCGERALIEPTEYIKYYAEPIYATSDCGSFEKVVGEFIVAGGEVYYLDYSDYPDVTDSFFALGYPELPAWRVTDESIVGKLTDEREIKVGANPEILIVITMVILVLVFAVLPAAAVIIGGILLVRSRGEYRRLLTAVVAIAAAALLCFIIMAVCFIVLT